MEARQVILSRNGQYPKWFNEECRMGRIKAVYDDDGVMIGATVHAPGRVAGAVLGDSIVKLKSGLRVVPAGKRKQKDVEKDSGE